MCAEIYFGEGLPGFDADIREAVQNELKFYKWRKPSGNECVTIRCSNCQAPHTATTVSAETAAAYAGKYLCASCRANITSAQKTVQEDKANMMRALHGDPYAKFRNQ